MGNKKLIYEYLVEYLNDELPENIKEEYLKEIGSNSEVAERFSNVIGKLQMAVQKLKLNEDEIQRLHSFVADSEERAHSEMRSISNMEDLESYSSKKSKLFWIIGIVAVLAFVFFYFKPTKAPVFDPLQTLSYESLALEDDSQGRIYFPTEDINEVKTYFDTDKTLGFTPDLLENIAPAWKVSGASIMDYEIAKVLLVQYENASLNEKLFHFILKGNYSLENKDEIRSNKFSFYPYASDQINMLVWSYPVGDDTTDQIVNIVASRRGVEELSFIVAKALNLNLEVAPSSEVQPQRQPVNTAPVRQQQQQQQQQQQPATTAPANTPATVNPQSSTPNTNNNPTAPSTTTPVQEDNSTTPETEVQENQGESILQEGTTEPTQLDIPMEETQQ